MTDVPYGAGVRLVGDLGRIATDARASAASAKAAAASTAAARDTAVKANIAAQDSRDGAVASAAAAAISAREASAATIPRSYPVSVTHAGQTVFALPVPPVIPSSLRLTVNGLAYSAPDLVIGPATVTWVNPDFALEPTDDVLLSYV